jgi:hypothetical protein
MRSSRDVSTGVYRLCVQSIINNCDRNGVQKLTIHLAVGRKASCVHTYDTCQRLSVEL